MTEIAYNATVSFYKKGFIYFLTKGTGRVKEGKENVPVSRLQVRDEDTKGTGAWRAKYRIHEDTNNIFRITTDPVTNEGLLYVEKVFCLCSYICSILN